MAKKLDRRVIRTRNLLRDAMLSLLKEKTYTSITVQDLTEYANLNRATFYLHFDDKETLLIDSLEKHFDEVLEKIDEKLQGESILTSSLPEEAVFQHVADNKDLYEVLMSPTGPGFVMQRMIDYIANFGESKIRGEWPEGEEPPAYLSFQSHHVAGGLFALLRWWLQNGMSKTPKEMAEISHTLTNIGALGFMQSQGDTPLES